MRQLPLLLVSLIASLAVLANAAGHWFERYDPDLSLVFNPLNPQARIEKVEQALKNEPTGMMHGTLISNVKRGLVHEPYNAKLYGLFGILSELSEDARAISERYYDHALSLNKTELRSLLRSLAFDVEAEKASEAVAKAELVFRAWPQHWAAIETHIPGLLLTPAGYETARENFRHLPGGPARMLSSLAKTDYGLEIARRLLLDWHSERVPDLKVAINTIISRLIRARRPLDAFLLHGLTLSPTEQEHAGFVFNSDFDLDPSGNPFDWRLPKAPGVGFDIVERGTTTDADNTPQTDRALEIRFLNTPVRLRQRLLLTRLPASTMRWSVTYSTRALNGPKPVQLSIRCRGRSNDLQTMTLVPTQSELSTITHSVSIPSGTCDLQDIWITNGNIVESWQNRYSGSIFLHQVDLQPNG